MCKQLVSMHFKSLERLDETMGVIIFICSILFSGIPCMIIGCCKKKDCWNNIIVGFLMCLTTPIFIGWIWAIYWGYQMWKLSSMNAVSAGAWLLKEAATKQ